MKIATFNVNSIRRRLDTVRAWLQQHRPDVLCLQETKVPDADFPLDDLKSLGYHVTFRGMKAFNGVATLSKEKPSKILFGFTNGPDPDDFRLIQTVIRKLPIVNTYVPQGTDISGPKFEYKLAWFRRLRRYFDDHLSVKKPAVWLGDLNVAPEPIDVYAPDRLETDPDFHPRARAAYQETLRWGWVDVFRKLHGDDAVQFTYWDFFRKHFERDRGWRIDHILATPPLAKKAVKFVVDKEPRRAPNPSDHTVVWAEFRI
jgi:exodeoxyribonuclease-3